MDKKILIDISAWDQRKIGRKMLSGKWKLAVMGTLIYMLAVFLPTTLLDMVFLKNTVIGPFVSYMYIILTGGAFSLGYTTFVLHIFRQRETTPGEVFSGFERFGRALGISLLVGIIVCASAIPFFIVFSWCLGMLFSGNTAWGFAMLISLILLYLPIRVSFIYSQVYFIATDHKEMTVGNVLSYSKWLMEGNKRKYLFMQFSFIGWATLASMPVVIYSHWLIFTTLTTGDTSMILDSTLGSLFTFVLGIGYIWLSPYMMSTEAAFYDIISGNLSVKQWDSLEERDPEGMKDSEEQKTLDV